MAVIIARLPSTKKNRPQAFHAFVKFSKKHHSWDSDSSGDYLVMSIRSKNKSELKVAGAKLPSTGTYRFKTGFYGLKSMPAEFQRVMDSILSEFPQAHAFTDDILITTKGSEIEHIPTVEKILKKLDKENMELKLSKSKFAQRECEWLGHRITPTGITPLVRKTAPIEALNPPRTLLQLKSFMGSTHSLHKYMPALA